MVSPSPVSMLLFAQGCELPVAHYHQHWSLERGGRAVSSEVLIPPGFLESHPYGSPTSRLLRRTEARPQKQYGNSRNVAPADIPIPVLDLALPARSSPSGSSFFDVAVVTASHRPSPPRAHLLVAPGSQCPYLAFVWETHRRDVLLLLAFLIPDFESETRRRQERWESESARISYPGWTWSRPCLCRDWSRHWSRISTSWA